jgi:hypothetical protein
MAFKINEAKLLFNEYRKGVQRPATDGHCAFKSFNDVISTAELPQL